MKPAILLVAYGTNSLQGQTALGNFDALVREHFPQYPVRWAFSSHLLRERMARARQKSDSVTKALEKLCFENFNPILIQPLQTVAGREHEQVRDSGIQIAKERGVVIDTGAPLLATPEDIDRVAHALIKHLPCDRNAEEDVVFMGHGGRHAGCSKYGALAQGLKKLDSHVHVGAMGGDLCLDSILPNLVSKRIWLMPLLATIGRHALEDMAGNGPDSWLSRIKASGHDCLPVLKGTVEYANVSEIWVDHLKELVLKHT